jgi:putative transposase
LGLRRDKALQIAGITKHFYYYKPRTGNRGRKPSTHTLHNGELVPNSKVVSRIEDNQRDPDLDYGYRRMTVQLKIEGYMIGKHKTYRLMKTFQLLHDRGKLPDKNYVKYRKLIPLAPYEVMEMDIKFVWVEDRRTHGYILTILDVFTRKVLKWTCAMSITHHTVNAMWTEIIEEYLQPNNLLEKGVHIEVRNDNDKRFSAKKVQAFFEENYMNQVFTHPYTPQENGHIESFHSIIGRSLNRFTFFDLEQLEQQLTLFYDKYNNERLHGSIASLPPNIYLDQWEKGNIIVCVDVVKRTTKSKLTIPYKDIIIPSGNENPKGASCLNKLPLDEEIYSQEKMGDVTTLLQPSVQKSPQVASC